MPALLTTGKQWIVLQHAVLMLPGKTGVPVLLWSYIWSYNSLQISVYVAHYWPKVMPHMPMCAKAISLPFLLCFMGDVQVASEALS